MAEQNAPADRPVRVGLLGHGVIGRVHRRVLEARVDAQVAFVVDPAVEALKDLEDPVPRYAALADALADTTARGGPPDLVVAATPTDTHLDVAGEALATTDALVLSEKPLTRDLGLLTAFEHRHRGSLDRLRVVNHFAFSPEVGWAVGVVAQRGWGPPAHVLSTFHDPYVRRSAQQRATYVSSWVDSGSNQLSLLARFVDGLALVSHDADADGSRSVTEATYAGGRAVLASSWWTGDSSKQTSLRWADGHELLLDHTAMTGWAVQAGRVVEHHGHDGTVDRKTAHYAAMYDVLLAGGRADPRLRRLVELPLARRVAALLAGAAALPAAGATSWVAPGPSGIRRS